MPRHVSRRFAWIATIALVLVSAPAGRAAADVLDLLPRLPSAVADLRPGGTALPGVIPSPDEAAAAAAGFAGPGRPPAQPAALSATATWSFETNVANAQLGTSPNTAGDVNGDGFSDLVALGRSGSNDALYLYLGSAGGPVLAPGYPLSLSPYSGGSVNAAGDVNGDGYGDIVLTWAGSSAGRLRVYYGTSTGLATGSPFDYFQNFSIFWGQNSGPAGDVNGDGFDDIIVGSPSEGPLLSCGGSGPGFGRVDIFYGSASGVTGPSWILWGCNTVGQAGLGSAAATAGDVNSDGYDDIVVGAPGAVPLGQSDPFGSAWVIYGSASGLPLMPGFSNMGTLAGATRVDSPVGFASFGTTACTAGDVNGDGYADVAVGAPTDDAFANDCGTVRVFAGSAAGLLPGTVLWYEGSGVANASFGKFLAPAGDVNADGKGDLLVAEGSRVVVAHSYGGTLVITRFYNMPYPHYSGTAGDVNGDGISDVAMGDPFYANGESAEGRLQVYAGAGDGPQTVSTWNVTTVYENPNLGWSVASAGDVNGDGLDDVLVGAPTWDVLATPSDVDNGIVFLYLGGLAGPSTTPSWYYTGAAGDQLGVSVCGVGDVNGDGLADIAVGAHQPGYGNGKVLVFHGGAFGAPAATLTGPSFDSYFGGTVTGGDFNGDGFADIAVGANFADPATGPPFNVLIADAGSAFAYLGSAGGVSASPAWSGHGGQVGEHYGTSLSGFADTNGDGFTDLVVGSPDLDIGSPFSVVDCGRITEYGGSASPGVLVFRQAIDGGGNERFGASVANAGDVNGDGFGDVVVGAPSANQTIQGQGRAAVHAGWASGVQGSPLWSQLGNEAFGGYGSSVSGAGDINGDGLSDVLVGAVFQENGGAQDRGTARVYLGPLPAGAAAAWTVNGPSAFANVGHCVANAGDVNGDGWSDLILGEPGYTGSFYRQGRAELFLGAYGVSRLHLSIARRTTAGPNIVPMGASASGVAPVILEYAPSAAGRTKFRLEWDLRSPVNQPASTVTGLSPAWAYTLSSSYGQLGANFITPSGLVNGMAYSWRVRGRFKSVHFPTSRWVSPVRSGVREYDLRTPGSWVDVAGGSARPTSLALSEAWPNPARNTSNVTFALPSAGRVELDVVDLQGRLVRTLEQGDRPAGTHRAAWNGRDREGRAAAPGVYFYRLRVNGEQASRRFALVR